MKEEIKKLLDDLPEDIETLIFSYETKNNYEVKLYGKDQSLYKLLEETLRVFRKELNIDDLMLNILVELSEFKDDSEEYNKLLIKSLNKVLENFNKEMEIIKNEKNN